MEIGVRALAGDRNSSQFSEYRDLSPGVFFGPRPAPALPEGGVLISPNFSQAIGLPFLFFYGSMWCVMAYVVGHLVLFRMRKERRLATASPSRPPDRYWLSTLTQNPSEVDAFNRMIREIRGHAPARDERFAA